MWANIYRRCPLIYDDIKYRVYDTTVSHLIGERYVAMLGTTLASSRTRHDYAEQIVRACGSERKDKEAKSQDKLERALTSSQGTWLRIVRSAIQNTLKEDVRAADWIEALGSAMCNVRVDWVPGLHSSRISSKQIVQLVGGVAGGPRISRLTEPGTTLKRRAAEAELRLTGEESGRRKEARRQHIDFGCELPFQTLPPILRKGFTSIYDDPQRKDVAISNHYQLAQNCILKHIASGNFRVQLMLMQVLTLAASSETPEVPLTAVDLQSFQPAKRRRDAGKYAVSLATRMLWFLDEGAFPWKTKDRGACPVTGMVKEIGKWNDHNHPRGVGL